MLINCPECSHNISDKAFSCPNCGYPMKIPQERITTPKSAKSRSKFKKLPNGFGTIRKLQGNRRNPYAVYPPVTEYDDNGSPTRRKALGYFKTYNDAYKCLIEYNENPKRFDVKDMTFKQVYDQYFEERYGENAKRKYSRGSYDATRSAYKHLSGLADMKMSEIKANDVQTIIDKSTLSHASLEFMVALFKQVSKYALKNDYIEKDYSQFIKINIADNDEKGVPFSEEELKVLWANRDDSCVQIALIMVCTGMRISELEKLEYLPDKQCFRGGIKTRAGKDRIIPIHDCILPYIHHVENFKSSKYRPEWHVCMAKYGLSKSVKDTVHTPHDCRHTFSWAWDRYVLPKDDLAKRMVMGHTLGKDVEDTVYGHRNEQELLQNVNKLYRDIFI